MNLGKKKELASRTLGIGKERIAFIASRLGDIKEAITKQDIRDLKDEGAIVVKEIKGRKKKIVKKKKRGPGKIKKKVKKKKEEYMAMVRKLRKYTTEMKKQGKVSREDVMDIRKKIRNRYFKSKANLRDYIGGLSK